MYFPATQHFVCHAGETWTRDIYVRESDGTTAVNLTGCSAVAKVMTAAGGTVVQAITCTITALTGKITLSLTAAQTAAMTTTALTSQTVTEYIDDDGLKMEGTGPTGVWALEITWSDASVSHELEGSFCIVPRVLA